MTVTRTDVNERYLNGVLVPGSAQTVSVDITGPATRADIVSKVRAALTANQTYQAIATPSNAQVAAQVGRLTRECSGLMRLLGALVPEIADLLAENTDT